MYVPKLSKCHAKNLSPKPSTKEAFLSNLAIQIPKLAFCDNFHRVSLCFPQEFNTMLTIFGIFLSQKLHERTTHLSYLVMKLAALLYEIKGWKFAHLQYLASPWTWRILLQELIPYFAISEFFLHGHLEYSERALQKVY